MTIPALPEPVTLVCGIIFSPDMPLDAVVQRLIEYYGPIEMESDVIPFDKTDFYIKEMGHGLLKKFFSFREFVQPGVISRIKLETNQIENEYLMKDEESKMKRMVNIDPGYVSTTKFVLVTTKDYGHRVYLSDGIYAEATLRFVRGSFIPFEYTYPDYRTEEYIAFLNKVRENHREKLRLKKCETDKTSG
jgi:hypothetical protein